MYIYSYLICLLISTSLFGGGVYVDYLLWTSNQSGLEFAITGASPGPVFSLDQGKVFKPKCQFDSGVRIGVIFPTEFCWNIDARYTFFQSNESATVKNLNTLAPLWFSDGSIVPPIDSARGDWRFQANVVDVVMSQCYSLDRCFRLTPFYGIKAAWNTFKYDISYVYQVDTDVGNVNRIRNLVELAGAGPRVGFRADWLLGSCFSLVSELSASCVFSDVWTKREDIQYAYDPGTGEIFSVSNFVANTTDVFGKQRHTSCRLTPVVELLLGVAYRYPLCRGRIATFFVGWEEQVWLYTEQFIHIREDTQSSFGSLSLQGLTVRGELQF